MFTAKVWAASAFLSILHVRGSRQVALSDRSALSHCSPKQPGHRRLAAVHERSLGGLGVFQFARLGYICRRERCARNSMFLGIWAAVWLAGWLAAVHFFTRSDLPAFIGGYLGCVSGAFVTYRAMGRLRSARSGAG
jgi:hypothetical protein